MAWSQLYSADEGRIIYGHHHINTQDLESQQRFWLEGLGGTVRTLGETGPRGDRFP